MNILLKIPFTGCFCEEFNVVNPLIHNVPESQTHLKNLAANAARFLWCA